MYTESRSAQSLDGIKTTLEDGGDIGVKSVSIFKSPVHVLLTACTCIMLTAAAAGEQLFAEMREIKSILRALLQRSNAVVPLVQPQASRPSDSSRTSLSESKGSFGSSRPAYRPGITSCSSVISPGGRSRLSRGLSLRWADRCSTSTSRPAAASCKQQAQIDTAGCMVHTDKVVGNCSDEICASMTSSVIECTQGLTAQKGELAVAENQQVAAVSDGGNVLAQPSSCEVSKNIGHHVNVNEITDLPDSSLETEGFRSRVTAQLSWKSAITGSTLEDSVSASVQESCEGQTRDPVPSDKVRGPSNSSLSCHEATRPNSTDMNGASHSSYSTGDASRDGCGSAESSCSTLVSRSGCFTAAKGAVIHTGRSCDEDHDSIGKTSSSGGIGGANAAAVAAAPVTIEAVDCICDLHANPHRRFPLRDLGSEDSSSEDERDSSGESCTTVCNTKIAGTNICDSDQKPDLLDEAHRWDWVNSNSRQDSGLLGGILAERGGEVMVSSTLEFVPIAHAESEPLSGLNWPSEDQTGRRAGLKGPRS